MDNTSSIAGYEAAKQRTDRAASALRDIAMLIGEPGTEPVTLGTGDAIVPGLGFREDAAVLTARAHDLAQGLFKIIVLGEFKNGKSTLLNSMLGARTLLAKAAPATAIITMLVYGDAPDVSVYEAGAAVPRSVPWEEFTREFQLTRQDQETLQGHGTVDRFAHVEYAQIECRHPICAHGVKLIDSPGLGEHISRTRVATNFLKQSQAVIMVLNATRILTQDERMFIETVLGEGRLNHVFFVVNRINLVDEESVPEIREWVRARLAHHFLDEHGSFDAEFHDRRVFFVDARGALEMRDEEQPDGAQLEATGVPALERELEHFLTSEEKVAAALGSTAQLLVPIVTGAQRRIEQATSALDEPLEKLEQRRAEAENRLQGLEGRRREIERTILLFGDTIKQKIYADLRVYVDEMHASWPEDSRNLMDLDSVVSLKNLVTAYAQKEAKDRMAAAIAEQVQVYVQAKFGQWANRIPDMIRRDVEIMVAEVEAQIEDFQLELDEIAALFAGTVPGNSPGASAASARLLQLALSLGDISGLTDAAMRLDDWAYVIGRLVQQAVLVFVVTAILPIGGPILALLIVEAIQLGLYEREITKRLRQSLGERLHESLLEQVSQRRAFVFSAIEERFVQFAQGVTEAITAQIKDLRAEQERILRQRRDERFSVETEKRRLAAVGERLLALQRMVRESAASGY